MPQRQCSRGGEFVTQGSVKEHWKSIQEELERQVGEESFSLYLRNTLVVHLDPQLAEIGVPNLLLADYLQERFSGQVRQAIKDTLGFAPETVKFTVNGHLFRRMRDSQREAAQNTDGVAGADSQAGNDQSSGSRGVRRKGEKPGQIFHMSERFRLEHFIVGSSNKLAFNCAVELAQAPGKRFSPLYIHGSCGTGKTHLLQGIARQIEQAHPRLRTLYVSAEYFTNQFLAALNGKRRRQGTHLEDFRERFRSLDVLLIDDLQFFCGKPKCQEELLHTLVAMEGEGKQVVLASDQHPKEMEDLPEGLRSRFLQGMVCQLEVPNLSMRVSLIKSKIQSHRDYFPDATVNFLATNLDCNVRELEGHMNQLIALAGVITEKLTVPLVKEALRDFLQRRTRMVELSDIENLIIGHYGVTSEDLHGRSRERTIATARQVCMYLARTMTQFSLKEIGRFFGNKNHTTVVFATQKVSKVMEEDHEFKGTIEHFKRQLLQRS